MPYQTIRLQPGINTDATPALNEGGWSECNLVRWTSGLPQKLGGWARFIPSTFNSPIRDLHGWLIGTSAVSSSTFHREDAYLAVGAKSGLFIYGRDASGLYSISTITPEMRSQDIPQASFSTVGPTPGPATSIVTVTATASNLSNYSTVNLTTPVSVGGLLLVGPYSVLNVITANSFTIDAAAGVPYVGLTPPVATATVTNGGVVPSFTTVANSTLVTVNFANHGQFKFDEVQFTMPTTVGGITIVGAYIVYDVTNANAYRILVPDAAASAATVSMNSAQAHFDYWVVVTPSAPGLGWSQGFWSGVDSPPTIAPGGWSTGTASSVTPGTPISNVANWHLGNWGVILIACQEEGPLFFWHPKFGFDNARIIAAAPAINHGMFIATPQQMIIAYGSTIDNIHDPLLVRWCDVGNFDVWNAMSTNQAGSYRISEGNELVGGMQNAQRGLLFTDISVWSMDYIGAPLIWSFNKIAQGCGLIGPHACTKMFGVAYWMSDGNFFALDGNGVQPIPCPVWDVVFQDLDADNTHKCVAAANSSFNEIAFYYPSISGGTGECDKYVKLTIDGNTWDYGTLPRSAWLDAGVLGQPIGGTPDGYVYQHEVSPDADGVAMNSYIKSGWVMLTEGDPVAFVDLIVPDMRYGIRSVPNSAQLYMQVETADWPRHGTVPTYVHGPFPFSAGRKWINLRARGRMVRFQIGSSDVGSFWRLGNMRYRGSVDGRRGV